MSDVEDARKREEATVAETKKRDFTLPIIAVLVILGFYVIVGILIYCKLPNDSNGIALYVLGVLSTAFSTIIGYYFGSSHDSAKNNEILDILKRLRHK